MSGVGWTQLVNDAFAATEYHSLWFCTLLMAKTPVLRQQARRTTVGQSCYFIYSNACSSQLLENVLSEGREKDEEKTNELWEKRRGEE